MDCKEIKKIYTLMCENSIDSQNYKKMQFHKENHYKTDKDYIINCIEMLKFSALYCVPYNSL